MKTERTIICFVCLYLIALLTTTCNGASPNSTLTVFAAASLTEAFGEIGAVFETAHPGQTVQFNFAGSQTLRTQIEAGAPADVYASANWRQMKALIETDLVAQEAVREFATNQLVVIVPMAKAQEITALADLARPDLKLVIGTAEVPVGGYTRDSLRYLAEDPTLGVDYALRVLANVVSEETTVTQIMTKVRLGEADAGVVFTSNLTPPVLEEVRPIAIPPTGNIVAHYPLAVVSSSKNTEMAQQFVEFILSAEGQAILQKWGFGTVNYE